jgi:YaiO family outer membrane protein
MLLSLLLTGLLTAQAPASAQLTHAEAAELATSGSHEQALDAFRRIAAKNPGDREARLWIGRLHLWMGHADLAEPVFRSVMMEDPDSVDAMVGLGTALTTLHRSDEALEILQRAEAAAPQNPEVLAALGRTHRDAGQTTTSLGYLQRAVEGAPTADNRQQLRHTRIVHDHRVESASFFETYNASVSDAAATDLALNLRMTDRFRVLGRGQVQRKFDDTEGRGGLGLEWRWRPETAFVTQAIVGPGNEVLPEVDAYLGVDHAYGAAEWTLGYRFIRVADTEVSVVSPAVMWWQSEKLGFCIRYSLSVTSFGGDLGNDENHSVLLNGTYRLRPRVWANLGYARNNESFDTLSADRLGQFRADTALGGLRLDFTSLTSLSGQYEYQWRPENIQMGRFRLFISQRF